MKYPEVQRVPGVYVLVGHMGQFYVGSSWNLRERLFTHRTAARRGASVLGACTTPDNFRFVVLDTTRPTSHYELPQREQLWLDRFIRVAGLGRCCNRKHPTQHAAADHLLYRRQQAA